MDSSDHIESMLESDAEFADAFVGVAAVSQCIRDVILPVGYHYPESFAGAIVLTQVGEEYAQQLRTFDPSAPEHDVRAAVLGLLAHRDPLIDVVSTDINALIDSFSLDVISREVRYPYLFHRDLYDKFFKLHGNDLTQLSQADTQELVYGTAQGVFQVRDITTGPFGLVRSAQWRYRPPTTSARLAHCREPACGLVHNVRLSTSDTTAGSLYAELARRLLHDLGPSLRWFSAVHKRLKPASEYYADVNAGDLLWLLGNGFSGSELRVLLRCVIDELGATYRGRLKDLGIANGSSADMTADLETAHVLQLLHLVEDPVLARLVDTLIYDGLISVPAMEKRRAPFSPVVALGAQGAVGEVSALGIRFAPRQSAFAVSRFKAFVRQTNTDAELQWALGGASGVPVEEQLDRAVHESRLEELASKFMLGNQPMYRAAEEYLKFGRFDQPHEGVPPDVIIQRLLWKLGFDVPTYPTINLIFNDLVDKFDEVVAKAEIDTDQRKQEVRSVGVNLFVALEDLLDQALAFTTWALLFDHYGRPAKGRFVYNLRHARDFAVEELRNRPLPSGEGLKLDTTGRNSLFGLVAGFGVLADVLAEMLTRGPAADEARSRADYPGWDQHAEARTFPFVHTKPLYDLGHDSAQHLIDICRKFTLIFTGANVVGMRNSVPHGGDRPFPTRSELALTVAALREAIPMLEDSGMLPLVFLCEAVTSDRFGRTEVALRNYRGHCLRLREPNELAWCHVPTKDEPQVIFQIAKIAGVADVLRFRVEVESEFAGMWADYPSRVALPDNAEELDLDGVIGEPLSLPEIETPLAERSTTRNSFVKTI